MAARRSDGSVVGLDRLDVAITEVVGSDLEQLADGALMGCVDRLHRAQARLAAERARVTAELERRRTRDVMETGPRDRARQRLRRHLAGRTNVTPSATKLDAQAGHAAARYRAVGEAFAAGEIGAEHARLIAETLDAVEADGQRHAAEQHLLGLARRTNPTVLGRHAREVLARQAPVAAEEAERRRHRGRRVTAYDTPDGGFAFSGLLYGTAAETARVALEAFRTPDPPGEHRTAAQRGADAFEQLCASALRAGDARTTHGVRPHVVVTVATDELELGDTGVARFGSGQPILIRQLRDLLDDCTWARVVLAPNSTPVEASEAVRTVPAGLWRALLARDGGCTWPGCDAPASWCDVAHGRVPFTDGGRLAPDNATLLCRRHHRRVDEGGYRIVVEGDRVTFAPSGETGSRDPQSSSEPTTPTRRRRADSKRGAVVADDANRTASTPTRPAAGRPASGRASGRPSDAEPREPPRSPPAHGQGRAAHRGAPRSTTQRSLFTGEGDP